MSVTQEEIQECREIMGWPDKPEEEVIKFVEAVDTFARITLDKYLAEFRNNKKTDESTA